MKKKSVIYKGALVPPNFTPADRILYSNLAYWSIVVEPGAHKRKEYGERPSQGIDKDGLESLKGQEIEAIIPPIVDIADSTGLSRMTIYRSLEHLRELRYLTYGQLYILKDLFEHPFYDLQPIPKLSPYEIIVYSYICSRCRYRRSNSIDTYLYKMADDLWLDKKQVERSLLALRDKGFINRRSHYIEVLHEQDIDNH